MLQTPSEDKKEAVKAKLEELIKRGKTLRKDAGTKAASDENAKAESAMFASETLKSQAQDREERKRYAAHFFKWLVRGCW